MHPTNTENFFKKINLVLFLLNKFRNNAMALDSEILEAVSFLSDISRVINSHLDTSSDFPRILLHLEKSVNFLEMRLVNTFYCVETAEDVYASFLDARILIIKLFKNGYTNELYER